MEAKSREQHLEMDRLLETWHDPSADRGRREAAARESFGLGLEYYGFHGPNATVAVLADLLRSPACKLDRGGGDHPRRVASVHGLRRFLMGLAAEADAEG